MLRRGLPHPGMLPAKSLIKERGVLQSWQSQPGKEMPNRHQLYRRCVPYLRSMNFVNASISKHRASSSKTHCLPSKHCSMRLGCGSTQVRARYRFERRQPGNSLTRATGC